MIFAYLYIRLFWMAIQIFGSIETTKMDSCSAWESNGYGNLRGPGSAWDSVPTSPFLLDPSSKGHKKSHEAQRRAGASRNVETLEALKRGDFGGTWGMARWETWRSSPYSCGPVGVDMLFTLPETNSKRPWKWMVGIRSFPIGEAYFQVRAASFREVRCMYANLGMFRLEKDWWVLEHDICTLL